jgi:hypothetical protein
MRASALTRDYDYSNLQYTAINKNDLGKININTRVFAQLGFGTMLADESMLFAAGSNPEDLMDNKYTRSNGFIPPSWGEYGAMTNHFTAGGGLNLRGYSGYVLAPRCKWICCLSITKEQLVHQQVQKLNLENYLVL